MINMPIVIWSINLYTFYYFKGIFIDDLSFYFARSRNHFDWNDYCKNKAFRKRDELSGHILGCVYDWSNKNFYILE